MFYSKMFCYLKVVNVYYLLKVKKNHIEKLHYFQNDEKNYAMMTKIAMNKCKNVYLTVSIILRLKHFYRKKVLCRNYNLI